MENKGNGVNLPWYISITLIFAFLVYLVDKSSMDAPGFWPQYWWPVLRLVGGFGIFMWFIDACSNGHARRSYKNKRG